MQAFTTSFLSCCENKCWVFGNCWVRYPTTKIRKVLPRLLDCYVHNGTLTKLAWAISWSTASNPRKTLLGGFFPESVIFLCSFHRLQAWLQWLVNGKNGVSQYKDQCMSILRSLGESKTEDEYTRNLVKSTKVPRLVSFSELEELLHPTVGP